jgi:dinuclear metal center YbgI/SA1388 family protein
MASNTTVQQVAAFLESRAPSRYQESYDNSGLLVGDPGQAVSGALVSLDCTEAVLDEAIGRGCNLVVAHHPIIFGGLKRLTGRSYAERTVMKALRAGISLYAIHTNLDNVRAGVNAKLCERLGLGHTRVLQPRKGELRQLSVFVPGSHRQAVFEAMAAAGAGQLGNYSHCSFQIGGQGTFRPNAQANPHIGQANRLEQVEETCIQVIFPIAAERAVLGAMRQAHPYEEVAFFLQPLENEHPEVGAGMVGTLPSPMEEADFIRWVKERLQTGCVRATPLRGRPVRQVAVCGGAGSFLRHQALAQGADAFVTADCKYHEFFDADGRMLLLDVGHYESEQFTQELLAGWLEEAFPQIPVSIARTATNPVSYW